MYNVMPLLSVSDQVLKLKSVGLFSAEKNKVNHVFCNVFVGFLREMDSIPSIFCHQVKNE